MSASETGTPTQPSTASPQTGIPINDIPASSTEMRYRDTKGPTTILLPLEISEGGVGSTEESAEIRERWNSPRINTYRYCVVNLSLFIMGMNDACIGALLPYIGEFYNVNYAQRSILFAVPFIAYVVAGLANQWLHQKLGQRGIAILGPTFRLLGYIPICVHPPFPVLPIALLLAGFGNGIEDSGYNAWVGNMENANELLGLVHGAYGLGGTVSPLIASAMVTKYNLPWYTFYYVLIGIVCLELAVGTTAFWEAGGAAYRAKMQMNPDSEKITTKTVLKKPLTWLVSIFLLGYVGVEVTLGGWIPTFMLEIRHTEPFLSGLAVTLFWLGLTIGRVVLGFVTGRIGEKLAVSGYLVLCIVFQTLYWTVPHFIAAIIFIILLGFFLGPLFPAAIVTATKLLPPSYHISAIGFAAAFGGGGAAFIPFVVGAIAQSKGVQVLQPFVLALMIFILICWSIMPGGYSRGSLDRARGQGLAVGFDIQECRTWFQSLKTSRQ